MGRRRTKQRPAKDQYAAAQNPPHLCSAAPRGRFGQSPPPVLWTMSSLWIPLPENHQLGRCKLLGAARIGGLTSRVCTAARLSGIRNSMPGRSRGGSLRGFPPGSGIAADARARLQPMPGEQPTHE